MTAIDAMPAGLADLDLEDRLVAFESAIQGDSVADLSDWLPPRDAANFPGVLLELIRVDLEFAWSRGERRPLEYYRDRFPELFTDAKLLREAIREEQRLRWAAGEMPDEAEYANRFGSAYAGQSQATQVFRVESVDDSEMPGPGQSLCGFRLLGELGAGAFGKVFLARETGLANRLVALKISRRFPGESQTLARLQHSHIVPIYSVHQHGPLHLICMPWLGNTTFADLLTALRRNNGLPASAQSVVSTLHERARLTQISLSEADTSAPRSSLPPILHHLEHTPYTDAILLFGEELADGLAHAHDRGVLHRDIKPANILLADDGRPMLLDFNLAADADVDIPNLGGTLRYMAPEVIAALAIRRGHADARADIYALGLILYELLSGVFPFADPGLGKLNLADFLKNRQQPAADLRTVKPDAAPGLAAILNKCLASNPADRYPSMAALRDDLSRQRQNLPLATAPNPSRRELLRKWARRHPRLTSSTTVGLAAALLMTLLAMAYFTRHRQWQRADAEVALHGLRDERDAIRLLLVAPDAPPAFARDAERRTRDLLNRFEAWGETGSPLIDRLAEPERAAARRDLGAIFAEHAAASRSLARHETDASKKSQRLEQSERAYEKAVALRAPYGDEADAVFAALQAGRFAKALELLDDRSHDASASPAVWYSRGYAHLRLSKFPEALRCFDAAVALAPNLFIFRFHRGVALQSLGKYPEAIADYDTVLGQFPADPDTLLNRALCHLENKDYVGAIQDLNALDSCTGAASRRYFIREEARRRSGDAAGARADFEHGLAVMPTDPQSWVARGRAKLRCSPPDAAGAIRDFESAVQSDDTLLTGWENLAATLAESHDRLAEALKAQDRVVAMSPASATAFAGRAVLNARLGHATKAASDIEAARQRAPGALALYQAASARILASRSAADRAAGLDLLRDALRLDPSWASVMTTDPDLKLIRDSDEFRRLIGAAKLLQSKISSENPQ